MSNGVTIGIAKSQFFQRVIDRMGHSKAVVRLNLLRIVRAVCEVHPNRAILVERYGIYEIVARLSKEDGAVLVRELAREIMPTLAPALKPTIPRQGSTPGNGAGVVGTPKYKKKVRRATSETLPVPRPPLPPATISGSSTSSATSDLSTARGGIKMARHKLNEIMWQSGGGGS